MRPLFLSLLLVACTPETEAPPAPIEPPPPASAVVSASAPSATTLPASTLAPLPDPAPAPPPSKRGLWIWEFHKKAPRPERSAELAASWGVGRVFIKGGNGNERRRWAENARPENLARYADVADRSGAFARGAIEQLQQRSDLCVAWIEHLLLFSMLQHPTDGWAWGRYVVVHPAENSDVVDVCGRYRATLADDTTFATVTLEHLLDSGTLPGSTAASLRDRYVALTSSTEG